MLFHREVRAGALVQGGVYYEDDSPAEEEIEGEGSWIPQENEHIKWQESTCSQKGKGKT